MGNILRFANNLDREIKLEGGENFMDLKQTKKEFENLIRDHNGDFNDSQATLHERAIIMTVFRAISSGELKGDEAKEVCRYVLDNINYI